MRWQLGLTSVYVLYSSDSVGNSGYKIKMMPITVITAFSMLSSLTVAPCVHETFSFLQVCAGDMQLRLSVMSVLYFLVKLTTFRPSYCGKMWGKDGRRTIVENATRKANNSTGIKAWQWMRWVMMMAKNIKSMRKLVLNVQLKEDELCWAVDV